MRLLGRVWLVAALALAIVALSAPAAPGAVGVQTFFAGNCAEGHENCGEEALGPYSFPKEPSLAEAEAGGYTQAAGHVPFGITHFKVTTNHSFPNEFPNEVPEGIVTHIRTDVAPGLSTNPTAVPQCSMTEFGDTEAVPGTGFFPEPKCNPAAKIGLNKVVVYVPTSPAAKDVPLEGFVYNLVQPQGRSSDFGVALNLAPLGIPFFAHTFIEGDVEWGVQPNGTGAGDYHDIFEINVSPTLPLISSRLIFYGRSGGDFVVNATRCPGNTTTTLHLTGLEGTTATRAYTPPIGLTGCDLVPFAPGFALTPETKQSDQPDGFVTELTVRHKPEPTALDSSEVKDVTVVLPEGMTLNPSGAQGLEACTPAQARIHSPVAGVACPAKSAIGTVNLEVPDLPPGSLSGNVYLGGPESGAITGPPYTLYIDAESSRYGISTRLEGRSVPDEATGRLTTTFVDNPEQPFSNVILHFKPGALAPIANPLVCGPARASASLVPYTGTATQSPFSQFVVDANGAGGACPSPLPFSLAQSSEDHPSTGAANANFTLNLARSDGQQYLAKVSATLPEGLVGKIPVVPLCLDPQATLGTCSSASMIGTATVHVGSGPTPVAFSGPVYLTGPYAGAPYGMTVVVNAAVGPFSLGPVVTRATISINPLTSRVTVSAWLPTIVKGVPIRLKSMSVAINRQGFLINPTNCAVLATETLLTSTFGTTQLVSTPFQATGCASLPFKPRLTASVSAKTSRRFGASFKVKIGYPAGAQANISSVFTQLPRQLPSRLDTLKQACLEATFNANLSHCPSGAFVGSAAVTTPVLPGKLSGAALFVSHGGEAFPDLDIVLKGPNGITIVLVGKTNISKGITTTTFSSTPDVPVSSFELKLPVSPHSALTAHGNLCAKRLFMPTKITAWNGKVIKQRIRIAVSGCGIRILSHRVRGLRVLLTVQAPAAGRVSGSGFGLRMVFRHVRRAGRATISVPLSNAGLRALRAARAHHRALRLRVRAGFVPRKGQRSVAFTTVVIG